MYENNRFTKRDRTTEKQHSWLKSSYKGMGFKSAAALLEFIIDEHRRPDLFKKPKGKRV